MTDWKETKRELLERYPTCQVVKNVKGRQMQCDNDATDLHHCLIKRNKRFGKWLDKQEWNYQPACPECNRTEHDADRPMNRRYWLEHQLEGYNIREELLGAPDDMQHDDFPTDWNEIMKWIKEIEDAYNQNK